jgi:P-type E1-E2 ATPase
VTQTTAFVAVDGRLAGYLTFHDAVRDEAKATLQSLRSFGMRGAVMITGDRTAAARVIARQLGITEVVAEQLPGDKLRELERLTDRPVAFVGDGVNDAPALMAADVGVALGARGSTAASESADVVIMKDDLRYVTHAVAIAKRSFRVATQSIAIGIGLSIVLMLVFATGKFSPITGAIAQEIVDVLVILNALRAHRAKPLSAS